VTVVFSESNSKDMLQNEITHCDLDLATFRAAQARTTRLAVAANIPAWHRMMTTGIAAQAQRW
jgi:hypothetical protein